MKIGIISDTHGNLDGWRRAMDVALSDADVIIHCGDVLYHGPKFSPVEGYDPAALAAALNQCSVPLLIARGNADADVDQLVLDMPLQQPYLFAQIEGLRILATHGHLMALEQLLELCRKWRVDLLLSGHTHTPVISRHDDVIHINPGTPTYPSAAAGHSAVPTCAAFCQGRAVIYDLQSGTELQL